MSNVRWLIYAIRNRDWALAYDYMEEQPESIWFGNDNRGGTPGYWAALRGNVDILIYMFNVISTIVEESEQQKILELAFERGNFEGSIAIHAAATNGHIDCLEFLTRISPRGLMLLEARNLRGMTPAFYAVENGHVEVLNYIMEHAPSGVFSLQEQDDNGSSLAYVAAKKGRINCLAFLIKYAPMGASILELENDDGDTPAHEAALFGQTECLEFIVIHAPSGVAVLFVENDREHTPLSVNDENIINYFTERKIKELDLIRDEILLEKYQDFDRDSLPALMLNLLKEQNRLERWRNK